MNPRVDRIEFAALALAVTVVDDGRDLRRKGD
jgi:hypothetical protein